MTRPFSLPTVLRMVPNDLLKQFLEDLGHEEFDPKWNELKKRADVVQPFLAYMDELPRPKYDELESGLHNVSDLASDGGFNALLEAGDACGIPNLGTLVPDDLCVWGRTMWAWLNHREIFDKAQILYQIEQMSWWRKRNDLPQNAPDISKRANRMTGSSTTSSARCRKPCQRILKSTTTIPSRFDPARRLPGLHHPTGPLS